MRNRLLYWGGAAILLLVAGVAGAEELVDWNFTGAATVKLFHRLYGDQPEVLVNGREDQAGRTGPAGRLRLNFGPETPHKLSYWSLRLPEPVPLVPGLQEFSLSIKTNVPVQLKVGISPFGFIYHGPGIQPAEGWQELKLTEAFIKLSEWCARGKQNPAAGLVNELIVAVVTSPHLKADITVDRVVVTAAEGTKQALAEEARRRKFRRVNVSVVTLPLSPEGRSLPTVLEHLDEAGAVRSDLVCLPMECIETPGEPIPGPLSNALAAKARQHQMYVIGNLREQAEGKTFVTSFLLDRTGELVGKYRKSHKLPDETMDLGDELPVFPTDFGPLAMKIGSDRHFADIDAVYAAQGAGMVFWSQEREPVEDEHLQDFPQSGRAQDYRLFIACARYARAETGWITSFMPTYRGSPIGRSYVINREGMRIASTTRKGSVATAVIPAQELLGGGRRPIRLEGFRCLSQPLALPEPRQWAKRRVRLTAIENHVGIEDLLKKIDEAARLGSDLVCTYELVWLPIHGAGTSKLEQQLVQAKDNLRRLAEKAAQHQMYVLVAGVIESRERNEAILYGRDGQEVGRYQKIVSTYPEQIPGTQTPILETDFGRIGIRICADNAYVEIDRAYGIKGADILFDLTQDWGPDAIHRNLRNLSRSMDALMFRVECTHQTSETQHRSGIWDPSGVAVAQSRYLGNWLVSAEVDLDNDRPRRYSRQWQERKPGGYLPEYQDTRMPQTHQDLREVVLAQRRPELYGALWPWED